MLKTTRVANVVFHFICLDSASVCPTSRRHGSTDSPRDPRWRRAELASHEAAPPSGRPFSRRALRSVRRRRVDLSVSRHVAIDDRGRRGRGACTPTALPVGVLERMLGCCPHCARNAHRGDLVCGTGLRLRRHRNERGRVIGGQTLPAAPPRIPVPVVRTSSAALHALRHELWPTARRSSGASHVRKLFVHRRCANGVGGCDAALPRQARLHAPEPAQQPHATDANSRRRSRPHHEARGHCRARTRRHPRARRSRRVARAAVGGSG